MRLLVVSLGAALCACTQDYGVMLEGSGAATAQGGFGTGATGGGGAGTTTTSAGGGSSTTSTSTTGSGGGAGCASGLVCAPDAGGGAYARRAAGAASCPVAWGPATAYGDGTDPGCTACTCNEPQNGTCTPGTLHGYTGASCGNALGNKTVQANVCADVSDTYSGLVADPPSASQGACAPSAVSAVPLVTTTICPLAGAIGSACNGGMCVPAGDATFAEVCVTLPAGSPCPAGFGDGATVAPITGDTRACSCACSGATGASCTNASVAVYPANGCSGAALATVPATGQCGTFASNNGSLLYDPGTWSGGSCPPQPGSSGAVTFGAALTICCTPG